MSRGGRGGFGRGRGGGGTGVPGGPWGGDDSKPDYSVTELFPPQPPPIQSSLSKEEWAMVARYKSHREKIHRGPSYTVMARKRDMEDPFNDIGKYSEKYKRHARRAPKLDARPYVYEFFPVELYPTIGKDKASGQSKRLLFSALDTLNPLEDLPGDDDADDAADGEDGEKKGTGQKTGDDLNEEVDAEISEDEEEDFGDDEDGDYNAEGYFEDGEEIEDFGDDDGGGGGYYD